MRTPVPYTNYITLIGIEFDTRMIQENFARARQIFF